MRLIKKSGKSEEFSIEKVSGSIAAASDESPHPINGSAIKQVAADLVKILNGKETVESSEVTTIVAGILYTKGYLGVLEHYLGYTKKGLR